METVREKLNNKNLGQTFITTLLAPNFNAKVDLGLDQGTCGLVDFGLFK